MPVEVRGKKDPIVDAIVAVLESYWRDHSEASVAIYRYSPVSVRVRIIDPGFSGLSRVDRNDRAWEYLDRLADDEQADVNMLVLLAPEEVEKSLGNMEFEDPVPSIWAEV